MSTPSSVWPRPTAALLALRPAIVGQPPAIPTPTTVADFQHQVLRPLLKFQHEVLAATVADFAQDYRIPLGGPAGAPGQQLLADLLARNARLRATLLGMVLGLLTSEEFAFYRQHRTELNRRLFELLAERLQRLPPS